MKRIILISLGLGIISLPVFAAEGFGEVADNIFGPVEGLTRLMVAAAYVTGAVLVMFGLLQYKAHRQNAKLVPLSVPIMLWFTGGAMLGLPWATAYFDNSWSAVEQDKRGDDPEGRFFETDNISPEVQEWVE